MPTSIITAKTLVTAYILVGKFLWSPAASPVSFHPAVNGYVFYPTKETCLTVADALNDNHGKFKCKEVKIPQGFLNKEEGIFTFDKDAPHLPDTGAN